MFAKLFVDSLNVQNISRFISERYLLSYITTLLALALIFYDIYIDAPICVLPTGTEKNTTQVESFNCPYYEWRNCCLHYK